MLTLKVSSIKTLNRYAIKTAFTLIAVASVFCLCGCSGLIAYDSNQTGGTVNRTVSLVGLPIYAHNTRTDVPTATNQESSKSKK